MKEILLTQDKVALVDEEDYEYLSAYRWLAHNARGKWYAFRSITHATIMMHRQIMRAQRGEEVDHINADGLDNRRQNLRKCSHAENQRARKKQPGHSSQFKGVSFYKRDGKWRARIEIGDRELFLGYFHSEVEAARAYDAAATEYFGDFAVLNFPRTG